MWDGPGQGPRGGAPFRGDHRGEMFRGRDGPMPDFRGRDGMNMGSMGPRPHDLPPMDMRRMEGPAMRGRGGDGEPCEMRGRGPNRDSFWPGEEPDFHMRRQYQMEGRDKLMNSSHFMGPGRNSDMRGRGMPPLEPNNRFMDMRDRDMARSDMPGFNNPNMDGRRGNQMDRMERNDGFRDMRDRPPMGMDDIDGCHMDMPPRDRRMMDFERRGGPPFHSRGGFDSDVDFRNRPGPSNDFRGRERSPVRFGNNDIPQMDRLQSDVPPEVGGPQRQNLVGSEDAVAEREFPDSPLMDYRSGEEMTLAEEWKNRNKDKGSLSAGLGGLTDKSTPLGFGREVNMSDLTPFKERERPPVEFPRKEGGFSRGGHFTDVNVPAISHKPPTNMPLPEISPLPSSLVRENEGKPWLGARDPKHTQNAPILGERPPYNQEKNQPPPEFQRQNDPFPGSKNMPPNQGPDRSKIATERDFQSSNTAQGRDQDYRDIDYRTGSGRPFNFKHDDFQRPEKPLKESKTLPPTKFSDSGSQDQDYRNASVEEKVSNTISIVGIPKTATMEQILGAFAVRDGVSMQGMKIKSVVPGYSYDAAYVEFLNLADAVHFMESNKGSLKVGTRTASMKYIQPGKCERAAEESDHKVPQVQQPPPPPLPTVDETSEKSKNSLNGSKIKEPTDPVPQGQWQRSSDITPEAWQQQVDQQLLKQDAEQQAEPWANRNPPRQGPHHADPIFKESKTMIIKNVKPTTTVETILKALDPFAYLDERNVRLVKAKSPGAKCFCFVDMDSHEQVTRLVELLTKPRPLSVDGVRVYAEVAKPLKNQRRDEKPETSLLGYPPDANITGQHYSQPLQYPPSLPPPVGTMPPMQAPVDLLAGGMNPTLSSDSAYSQEVGYGAPPIMDPSYQAVGTHLSAETSGMTTPAEATQTYVYGSETPDVSNYLYDATSGFYYDPETTLYYDPSSRYFYNAQTQEYLYWDANSKMYVPVPSGSSTEAHPVALSAEVQAILSNPAADAPLEMKKPSEALPAQSTGPPVTPQAPASAPDSASDPGSSSTPGAEKREEDDAAKKDKEKDSKEEKPRSLAAVKIMKDMERWAKIQNRQKDSVRTPWPVLKTGGHDDRKTSKAADAGFAVFERKGGEDLFKKPLAPPKKDEKGKRPMGSLGLLASDYAAGSDEEVEEEKQEKQEAPRSSKGQLDDKEDKLTDWKKMACLLCRRQFPNKDALVRHQQLSDLHKQNMEIHLKIKSSKKELEALENQEKEVGENQTRHKQDGGGRVWPRTYQTVDCVHPQLSAKEPARSPEQKRRKHQHNTWAGSSRETHKVSERPGLGAEPVERKKKEPVVWDHATYKQAVRKAMFARFKELE